MLNASVDLDAYSVPRRLIKKSHSIVCFLKFTSMQSQLPGHYTNS